MLEAHIDNNPHDLDAESQLIGWVLCDQKLLNHAFIPADAFYEPLHFRIWEAMLSLSDKGQAISPYTIKPLLPLEPDLLKYLGACIANSILMTRPLDGIKYLAELYQKRIMLAGLSDISTNDPMEVNIGKLNILTKAIAEKTNITEFETNLEVSDGIMKDMADKRLPCSTGLPRLDNAMDGGLFDGKAYGFAARKKVGKTALAATISANLNENGIKHLFVCGEMSPKEIHQRILSRTAEVFPNSFRSSYGNSKDCQNKLTNAISRMKNNILYKNAPAVTFDALRQIFTVAVEKHHVKGIILDYWQLVGGKPKNKSTSEHLDEVAQYIADFGRTYNIWTITFAQINQEGNTRGSEGVRLAFDQLYELHREDLSQPDAWLEMMETRYTPWVNPYGDKNNPKLLMNERGPFFQENV